jgi:hypothetical protein
MSELLNVAEVAAVLKVSPDTVVRRFAKVKGVVNLGSEETRGKRRYRVLRIPKHVVEKFVGHPIDPVRVDPRRQAHKDWMSKAAHSLAKAMIENAESPTDRNLFKKILTDARTLTFVPEEQWGEVTFCEEEDQ